MVVVVIRTENTDCKESSKGGFRKGNRLSLFYTGVRLSLAVVAGVIRSKTVKWR